MWNVIKGLIGLRVKDLDAEKAAFFDKHKRQGWPDSAIRGKAHALGLLDEDRHNFSGRVGNVTYSGRAEIRGKAVSPEKVLIGIVDELRPVGAQLKQEFAPLAAQLRRDFGRKS